MLWIVGLLTLYVLVLLAISWVSLHPPRTPAYISPSALDMPQTEIVLESNGIRLRAWWMEASESEHVAVLAHGYVMNRCELTPEAAYLWRSGCSCLLFDFRAHGKSGGKKCSFGYFEREDVAAAVREARRRKPGAKVVLIGSSMGAAASALALADDPLLADALVLDSSYSRLTSATLGWWRFLGGKLLMVVLAPSTVLAAPFAGFNPFRVDIAVALAKLKNTPILFFHGARDNLALPSEAERNIAAHTGAHRVVWFENCGHCEGRWEQPGRYRTALTEFLSDAMEEGSPAAAS